MRLRFVIELNYDVQADGAEFIFNIQAARTPRQFVVRENLDIGRPRALASYEDRDSHTRLLRVGTDTGPLNVRYEAVVDIDHHRADPATIMELDVPQLPGRVLPFVYPSRYCQSDRLLRFASAQFGHLPRGYARVQAIRDWVAANVAFTSNSTTGETSACDTLVERQGVCRDFAHLMIALCRAVNVPARFASGIDYGADPALGPQDFHAYVETYLGGRWYMFDPSGTAIPMGFVRLATGRDAADAAFCTIFGPASMRDMRIQIEPLPGQDGVLRAPFHTTEALSTQDGDAG